MTTVNKNNPRGKQAPTILSVDQILESADVATVTVEIPEWGGSVKIKELQRQEMLDCRKNAETGEEDEDGDPTIDIELYEMHLLVAALVEPSFAIDQIGQLRKKNGRVVGALIAKITVLLGAGEAALKAAEKSSLV